MASPTPNPFYTVIQILETSNIPLENLIRRALLEPGVSDSQYVNKFLEELPRLLKWLYHHERSKKIVEGWMKKEYLGTLTSQIRNISKPDKGFHFNAGAITAEKMKECTIENIANGIQAHAPDVWDLVGNLMESDPAVIQHRKREREKREDKRKSGFRQRKKGNREDDDERLILELIDDDEDEPEDIEEQLESQRLSLLHIKQVTCISIMMQATNQRCNSLQSLVGIFLQSCNVPDQIRNFLSHLGVSVAVSTINRAIKNLSEQAEQEIRGLGATLRASYAYDNLDVQLSHSTPTLETSIKDNLVHLTTASMFPLHPMTTKDNLNYVDQLRELALHPPIPSTVANLLASLPPEYSKLDNKKRSIQDRFNCWKFIADLVTYGPSGFESFKKNLGEPEEIDCIPLVKTKQVPLRASKTAPNTPAKNATVIEEFFRQSNIGERTIPSTGSINRQAREPVDTGNTVIPTFGDLLTGQHLHSLQASRIEDVSPGLRFQGLAFCHGWFHVRMACADAIWRRHIQGSDPEKDTLNLMRYIIQIRPLEKHKILTNPNFRQLHEVILHVGIVLRLDAWRVEVSRRHPEISSLEEWAQTNPTWEELCEIAEELAKAVVASPKMLRTFRKDHGQQDELFERTKAYHKDFLLYEETNYAMNHGDMGRLDACLSEWLFYFMGCGKAKYAQEIFNYLENMYVRYPAPLARAIRMNSLVNPTGKKDCFRGVDWVIEHNNLYIKRIFGGSGSNHTVDRMVNASPLIEVYKDVREQFEKMFCLTHKTGRHSAPKMKRTFDKLGRYMEKHKANEVIIPRGGESKLLDVMQVGMDKLTSAVDGRRKEWTAKATKQTQLKVARPDVEKQEPEQHQGVETLASESHADEEGAETEDYDKEVDVEIIDDDGSLFVDENI